MWIFGYGSLIWKVDFKYVEKCKGFITGFQRRFYQNSIDHRGTAENVGILVFRILKYSLIFSFKKPGRVVTLIRDGDPNAKVFGMAYKLSAENLKEVMDHLDHREKNGYSRQNVKFYPYPYREGQTEPIDITLYLADHDNPSYAGHIDDLNDIASQIFSAKGPSGENKEYVFKLADAMRSLYPDVQDDHLYELERMLNEMGENSR